MAQTELFCEPRLLDEPAGRRLILETLRQLSDAVRLERAPEFDDGWLVIPADPLSVFRALQRIDPRWPRFFALIPSDEARRSRTWRVSHRSDPRLEFPSRPD